MKRKVHTQTVYDSLPEAPRGYSYTVERVTPRVIKVWINDHRIFSYTADPVRSVYCFVKGDKVHAPRNKEKMRVEALCDIDELSSCDPYSTINDTHTVKSLLHL